jgi:hypothetical protein
MVRRYLSRQSLEVLGIVEIHRVNWEVLMKNNIKSTESSSKTWIITLILLAGLFWGAKSHAAGAYRGEILLTSSIDAAKISSVQSLCENIAYDLYLPKDKGVSLAEVRAALTAGKSSNYIQYQRRISITHIAALKKALGEKAVRDLVWNLVEASLANPNVQIVIN